MEYTPFGTAGRSASLQAAAAAVDFMDGMLGVARGLLEGGRRVDLTGLDREMATLCTAVLLLDPEDRRALRPAMEELLRRLDSLLAGHRTTAGMADGAPP